MTNDLTQKRNINNLINSSIFVPYNYCNYCFKNNNKQKKINYCDVLAGFDRSSDSDYTVCNVCLHKYNPLLFILFEDETKLDNVNIIKMLSPIRLIKEIDEIIKNEGEKYFFLNEYYLHPKGKIIFYNILFYFELFGLPNLVMILHQDTQYLKSAVDDLMVILENAKKINNNNRNSNNYSSVQLKSFSTFMETENSENASINESFYSESISVYNENEKKLDEKM
jgi:hypothetical protein